MTIYIDISSLILSPFITGIQRVVLELVYQLLLEDVTNKYVLLSQRNNSSGFVIVGRELFLEKYNNPTKIPTLDKCFSLGISELNKDSIFFDLDAVWNIRDKPRSDLYPKLKSNGIKIASYFYDIIPLTFPQFCHGQTVFFYLNYLTASLLHSDLLFTSTEDTAKQIKNLVEKLNLKKKNIIVTGLGIKDLDFNQENDSNVREALLNLVKSGPFALAVGTIEPRKNHLLLLKACEDGFRKLGLKLVLVGKSGWNNDEILRKISGLSKKKLCVWFDKLNDHEVHYLYSHAFCTLNSSFEEGYGLPIIESLLHKTLTFVSDIPVFREVGGSYCDYFSNKSSEDLLSILTKYVNNRDLVKQKKQLIANFTPLSWSEVANTVRLNIERFLKPLNCPSKNVLVNQLFFLTNRPNLALQQLYSCEIYIKFLQRVLIACPRGISDQIKRNYKGRLKLEFVFDEDLPDVSSISDHAIRNFSLRSLIIQSEKLDNLFIMADDDNRPVKDISLADFYDGHRYSAYYFYKDISKWSGELWAKTSFDKAITSTADFLIQNDYPRLGFDSHMPQLIDKRIFLEMLEKHSELIYNAYSEWSTYFNYLAFHYPNKISIKECPVMCWPCSETDWDRAVYPDDIKFENFYVSNYSKGEIFDGLSIDYNNDDSNKIKQINKIKIERYKKKLAISKNRAKYFNDYCNLHFKKFGYSPSFGIIFKNRELVVSSPKAIWGKPSSFYRIPLSILLEETEFSYIYIHYEIMTKASNNLCTRQYFKIDVSELGSLPIFFPNQPGSYMMTITFYHAAISKDLTLPLNVTKP